MNASSGIIAADQVVACLRYEKASVSIPQAFHRQVAVKVLDRCCNFLTLFWRASVDELDRPTWRLIGVLAGGVSAAPQANLIRRMRFRLRPGIRSVWSVSGKP